MNRNNLIIIAVIGGIILLGLGFYSGLNYAQKQIEKAKTSSPLANLLTSKVIGGLNTTAFGEITEISGRNITLSNEGDALTISIKEDATIFRLLPPEGSAETPQPATREEIEFEEIKVGDQVNISCQLKADETLEGVDVMVLPQ